MIVKETGLPSEPPLPQLVGAEIRVNESKLAAFLRDKETKVAAICFLVGSLGLILFKMYAQPTKSWSAILLGKIPGLLVGFVIFLLISWFKPRKENAA